MKNREYWEKRAEQAILTSEKDAEEIAKKVEKTYKECMKSIENEINRFYARFSLRHQLTLEEVKKMLNPTELKAFKEQAKLYYDEAYANNWRTAYSKHMRILSAKAYMSRLEELKVNIYHQLQRIYEKEIAEFTNGLKERYNETFLKTMYDYQSGIGYGSSFTIPNSAAVERSISTKFYGENYSSRIWSDRDTLVQILDDEIPRAFVLGESPDVVAKRIRNKIAPHFAKRTREGRKLTSKCERIARTEFNHIANKASFDATTELNSSMGLGITEYQYLATLDNKTSEICRDLDGKTFKLKEKQVGVNFPPMHPNCYDDKTEVYTAEGWKLFKDCKDDELYLSMNPENEHISFIPAVKKVQYQYDGEMISFKNRTFDLSVTPDHMMIKKYMKKDGSGKFKFETAEKIGKSSAIPRGCKWEGVSPEYGYIGGYKIDIETYLKFMAWYLSDGSTTKTGKNSYRVKIAQETHFEYMWEQLQNLPFKITKTDCAINTYDYEVGKEMSVYGKCNEKFIPNFIKNLSADLIKIFLEAYSIADGTVKKGRQWKGGKFEDAYTFFTTSKRLADDLGELILKAGGRPSFFLQKAKTVKHHNGVYTGNYDTWALNWCNRVWSYLENIEKSKEEYSGMVYCVELPKWHTLYVRRNGKCCWCGNCRSTYTMVLDDEEITERIAKDKTGKYYYVPSNMTYKEWQEKYNSE